MCGICGFAITPSRFTQETLTTILARMNNALFHRGPDDEGHYLDVSDRHSVGLAMRRLAIIDVSNGHQPMASADGKIQLVFNGEIYNFRELRTILEQKGYVFYTNSDTEVVLRLYEDKGLDFVHDLNGMFAIAIWNRETEDLLLIRDRFGKKPLYYTLTDGSLAFSSELKSLLKFPPLAKTRSLDPNALALFLTYDYVPYPYSILSGVKKLPPGTWLHYHANTITLTRYFNPDFGTDQNDSLVASGTRQTSRNLAIALRARLKQAVAYRLESDVPLGVFLSGGLDSSLITALMCELRPPQSVKTFSIHFDEKSFDESDYSTQVARFLGTDHHTHLFKSSDMVNLVPTIARMIDEPFADASIFPTYLLSQFTRQHVTVALSGDGSDELFAGYPTFQADRLVSIYRALPSFLKKWIERAVFALPASTKNMSLEFKLKQFLLGAQYDGARRQQAWLAGFRPNELSGERGIFTQEFSETRTERDPYALLDHEMTHAHPRNSTEALLYFYMKFYLAEDILTKSDRASMANSLEVRAPFLDKEVARFAMALPSQFKLRGFTTKYLVKEAARGLIPNRVIDRPKKGFGVPVASWFRHELKEFIGDHLRSAALKNSGIFNHTEIDRLLQEHWSGAHDHRKKLFPLLMFALWQETYLTPSA